MPQYLSLNCSSFHALASLAEEALATPGALNPAEQATLARALVEMQTLIEALHSLPSGDLLCFNVLGAGAERDVTPAPSPVEA